MDDNERTKLWAAFEEILHNTTPFTPKWDSTAEKGRIVFAAMLDLHERMLEMEKRYINPLHSPSNVVK